MELIPKEIKEQIPKLYETEEQTNPIAYIKLFLPDANWTWYITELSMDGDTCFGLVISPFTPQGELGYFLLQELSELKGQLGLGLERDIYFTPTSLSIIKQLHKEVI